MKRLFTRVLMGLLFISVLTPELKAAVVVEPVTTTTTSTPAALPTTTEPDPEAVKENALNEFKSLSRHEKKARLKDAKKLFKDYRAAKKARMDDDAELILLAILAILLPPLAVYLKEGELNVKFWISLLLAFLVLLGFIWWLPGVIFALLVVFDVI